MMKLILFVVVVFFTTPVNAQSIAIYNAYINERPKTITPAIGDLTSWGHEPNVVFELSYDFKPKLRVGIRYFYDDYPGFVGYLWEPSDQNIRSRGAGFGGTKMIRYGIFGTYDLVNLWQKVSLSSKVYIDYQSFNSQSQEPNVRTKRGNINGGGYMGPDRGERFLTTYDEWQILPSEGLHLSYRPFWKVVLHAEIFYSHGFVPHSRLEVEYTDLEVPQPTAEYVGNGTSITYTFGLGFRLWE